VRHSCGGPGDVHCVVRTVITLDQRLWCYILPAAVPSLLHPSLLLLQCDEGVRVCDGALSRIPARAYGCARYGQSVPLYGSSVRSTETHDSIRCAPCCTATSCLLIAQFHHAIPCLLFVLLPSLILLFSYPTTGSLKLIACFPDQLLLACTAVQKLKSISLSDISSGTGSALNSVTLNARLNFSSRPCSPLEPVVLGLISMTESMLRCPHTDSNQRKNSIGSAPRLGGEVPYIDPYTGMTPNKQAQGAIVKDLSRVSETERHILLLRALVTTHCPPRPAAGDTAVQCCVCACVNLGYSVKLCNMTVCGAVWCVVLCEMWYSVAQCCVVL
jgi:hypothetical protein